jgi:hypothetical protein
VFLNLKKQKYSSKIGSWEEIKIKFRVCLIFLGKKINVNNNELVLIEIEKVF